MNGPGKCGTTSPGADPGRCGYGPRLPLLVISPYARANFVDHSLTDQSSILRFIEDNWNLGRIGDQSYDELAGSLRQHVRLAPRRCEAGVAGSQDRPGDALRQDRGGAIPRRAKLDAAGVLSLILASAAFPAYDGVAGCMGPLNSW